MTLIPLILDETAKANGVSVADMCNTLIKPRDVSLARRIAWWLIRTMNGDGLKSIARHFGCDHTAVLIGVRSINHLIQHERHVDIWHGSTRERLLASDLITRIYGRIMDRMIADNPQEHSQCASKLANKLAETADRVRAYSTMIPMTPLSPSPSDVTILRPM